MFNLSGSEIVVILLLALVVLGPEKLPDAIRRAGRTYAELKKMGNSFQAEMKSVLDEPMKEMRETADLLKRSVDFTDGEMTGKKAPPRLTTAPTQPVTTTAPGATSTPDPTAADAEAAPAKPDGPATAPAQPAAEMADPPRRSEDELINRTLSGEQ